MENRAIKIIRWILLVPFTFAVPIIVFDWITGGHIGGVYSLRSIWWSIRGLAPAWAMCFIPFFLVIPIATIIAPSRKKKVAIIALVFGALASMAACLPNEYNMVYEVAALSGRFAGLLAGGIIVYWALKQGKQKRPYIKKACGIFAAIVCVVGISAVLLKLPDSPERFVFHDFKSAEVNGVATYSFGLENKTNTTLNLVIDLVAERRTDPSKRDNSIEIGRTQIELLIPAMERKDTSGQFPINESASGHFLVYPVFISSTSTEAISHQ